MVEFQKIMTPINTSRVKVKPIILPDNNLDTCLNNQLKEDFMLSFQCHDNDIFVSC